MIARDLIRCLSRSADLISGDVRGSGGDAEECGGDHAADDEIVFMVEAFLWWSSDGNNGHVTLSAIFQKKFSPLSLISGE